MKHIKFKAIIFAITVATVAYLLPAIQVPAQTASRGAVRRDSRILYRGGSIMPTASNVYLIRYGNWQNREATFDLLNDFATSYSESPYAQILTTYPDFTGASPSGELINGGWVPNYYSHSASLTDADVQASITAVLYAQGLPVDPRGIYLLLASPDVYFDGFCTNYCQYHKYFVFNGTPLKYAVIGNPDRCPTSCAAQFPEGSVSPNGDPAGDAMASWMAHVLNETMTNPFGTAWYDRYGLESSDKCVGLYGQTYTTPTGARANMRLGARDYLIQQNWLNDRKGRCALSYQ
jgi:hypothetical protein